jgi:hypothetical protein
MTLWRRVAIGAAVAILLTVVTLLASNWMHANDIPTSFGCSPAMCPGVSPS